MSNPPGGFNFNSSTPFSLPKSSTAPAGGGFSFGGAAPQASTAAPTGGFNFGGTGTTTQSIVGFNLGGTSTSGGFSLGTTPAATTGGFNLGTTPAATTGGFNLGGTSQATTGFSFGGTGATTTASTLTGLLSQPVGAGLGGLAPKTTGVTFGQTTQLGGTSTAPTGFGVTSQPSTGFTLGGTTQATTGLSLGATTQPSTGFTLGGTSQATTGLSLGGTSQAATGLSLGGTSQASTGLSLGGTSQASAGLSLGGTSQPTTAGFSLGAKPPLQSGLTIGATGLNLGPTTSAGTSIFGQTATKPQVTGLGGVDPNTSTVTSGGTTTDTKSGDGKSLKESQLPPELMATVNDFQKYVKTEKAVEDDLSRSTTKPLYKVQEDVAALRQLLSVVSNGLQRNAVVVDKLKHEMTQELKNAEMALRTKDIPPGLQYENTAPAEYYHRLVEDFESQMLSYRQQIETLEEHLASTHQPSKLTPDDLILLLRKLHETFIALAAQLHQVHEAVKTQKEHYLNYRKIFLRDTKNIFETEKKPVPQVRHDVSTHLGPTAFGGLSNAAAVAMASALTRSQQPAGPPVAGLSGNLGQTTGFGSIGLFGASTTQPAFGGTTSTQSGIGGECEYEYITVAGRTVKITKGSISEGFGGFGSTATTQSSGFKGFGFGAPASTQSTGFGFGTSGGTAAVRPLGFGTTTTTASGFLGQSSFGQTSSPFGTPTSASPTFGTSGDSTFQLNKPPTSKKKR